MRESRPYGSVRGARDETHVPTTTASRVLYAARRRSRVAARGPRTAAGQERLVGVVAGFQRNLISRGGGVVRRVTRVAVTGEICLRPVEARHESDTWGQRGSAFGTIR